jgi:hypothetical protein
MACTLAESPSDPFHRKLRQLRCLCRRLDCYRVERTSSRAGVAPAEVQRLSRRTFSPTTLGLDLATDRRVRRDGCRNTTVNGRENQVLAIGLLSAIAHTVEDHAGAPYTANLDDEDVKALDTIYT